MAEKWAVRLGDVPWWKPLESMRIKTLFAGIYPELTQT